ncbi:hypothetical protein PHYBLDRAFT_176464 [Phycomyces blakesleeanus NRRL 1555(-)]|uniref:Uncharacterized protein n=1 Tax=Phycomyces blakesleeanus (strain ATCC 8743b / DSM 1359 / FGSC 10004 / NBRC 33097 / NRRL 1555) TaxID=763407 RepID=A0A163CRD6_PHYB8|nr:hypothetical protein PHYBLDRAFT_176464 [Phycomyces blakesleeanus NRRL 1555(-)]OAD65050.1 hypothetical protein PHYBLDRAFT_176464 [Phycomyces blakesleeanus NRRL 1555(-)]|eukprot:XP_018283090.1 hypothetical protein PHYBLDRAFT_176464 [Phycomyces blakesleeanus NRRL 1555(-)]
MPLTIIHKNSNSKDQTTQEPADQTVFLVFLTNPIYDMKLQFLNLSNPDFSVDSNRIHSFTIRETSGWMPSELQVKTTALTPGNFTFQMDVEDSMIKDIRSLLVDGMANVNNSRKNLAFQSVNPTFQSADLDSSKHFIMELKLNGHTGVRMQGHVQAI